MGKNGVFGEISGLTCVLTKSGVKWYYLGVLRRGIS